MKELTVSITELDVVVENEEFVDACDKCDCDCEANSCELAM